MYVQSTWAIIIDFKQESMVNEVCCYNALGYHTLLTDLDDDIATASTPLIIIIII